MYEDNLDNVVGVLVRRDLEPYLEQTTGQKFNLRELIHPPQFIPSSARLGAALKQMQSKRIHLGFVVDEYGGLEGIVTLEDLLEEIVGEINDEFDEEVRAQILKEPDGTYLLSGMLTVRDANRQLGLDLPEDGGYTTLAGFLMAQAGRLPQAVKSSSSRDDFPNRASRRSSHSSRASKAKYQRLIVGTCRERSNMKLHILLALTLLLVSVSSASAKDDITKELMTSNGKTRAYYLYVPSTVKGPAPLIITLHGSNRTGVTLVEKWKDYAKKEGIILAGPDASNLRGWGSPQRWSRLSARVRRRTQIQTSDQPAPCVSVWSLCWCIVCAAHVVDGVAVFCCGCGSRRRTAFGRGNAIDSSSPNERYRSRSRSATAISFFHSRK